VLTVNGIKYVPTTVANPQLNAINERLHQTIENTMRTMLHTFQPQNPVEAATTIDNCYATAWYAVCSAVNRTLNVSPGTMVFHRGMVLRIPLIADFAIKERSRPS
jgi:hypothetical protein